METSQTADNTLSAEDEALLKFLELSTDDMNLVLAFIDRLLDNK